MLTKGFKRVLHEEQSFEDIRDTIRHELHTLNPAVFPIGHVGTSVAALATEMLRTNDTVTSSQLVCTQCDYEEPKMSDRLGYIIHADRNTSGSTSTWVRSLKQRLEHQCPECLADMHQPIYYDKPPMLLVLEYPTQNVETSHRLKFNKPSVDLYLKGIVYLGGYHFTCRIFSENGKAWYHDGRSTKNICIDDGNLTERLDTDLRELGEEGHRKRGMYESLLRKG